MVTVYFETHKNREMIQITIQHMRKVVARGYGRKFENLTLMDGLVSFTIHMEVSQTGRYPQSSSIYS